MRRGLAFAGCCALLLAAITTLVSAQQVPAGNDPLELFTKMMPVFSHPRCANCHGGIALYDEEVAAMSAVKHGGGVVTSVNECAGCHNSSQPVMDAWRLADHQNLRFFGKDAKQLCEMQRDKVKDLGRASYLRHIETDVLIAQAFEGRAGGQRSPADPPPMSKGEFKVAARAWLDAGAGCGAWKGTITQTETFASNYGFPLAGGTHSIKESANRLVRVNREQGSTTADIVMSGHGTQQVVIQSGSCTTTITNEKDWNNAASQGTKPAAVRFKIKSDGSYEIYLRGPPEKTHTDDTGVHTSTCGSLPQPTPGGTDLNWDPWKFTIRCPLGYAIKPDLGESFHCTLFDPAIHPGRLEGKLTRVLVERSDAAEPQSWLGVSPASVGRGDSGEPLPITVITEWDFVLVE